MFLINKPQGLDTDKPSGILGLLTVYHNADAPPEGTEAYADVKLLPPGTTVEDALFIAMEEAKADPKLWETFVVNLVPVDGVEGPALIAAADARAKAAAPVQK